MQPIYPVVLSGGAGTRLWPLSRAMYPKQFIRFSPEQKSSFLAATLQRLPTAEGFSPPLVICNNDHRFLVKAEAESVGVQPGAIVLEPVGRNTAPAIAAAALLIARRDPDGIMVVMPSDHMIRDEASFRKAVLQAARVAATGKLVLFGIRPTVPHTGYGYIRVGAALTGFDGAFVAEAFTEKPDRTVAEDYLSSGNYVWNSGIFVFTARAFLAELDRLEPSLLSAVKKAVEGAREDLGFLRLDREAFAGANNISIDYAVMERTAGAVVIPVDVGWSDVGSWSSLWEVSPRDEHGNAVTGDGVLESTTNSYVHSERALVATLGVNNLVIIDTPDALLVADREEAENVSGIVATLKAAGRKEREQHIRNYRPWGYFETLNSGPRFQVKLLHVKPGGKLSMQMHHHRSEHWVVVHGTAKVTVGDEEKLVYENQSVYIVATQWHRLENPGKTPLEMIEVQIGSYLGEDDIVRADDVYNRSPDETK
ncbi:MAG TPA: mannose-1-phosphate guanylyltransferase/mannose-6-phosphate isomerase [Hyphomicrobiaceae bacterium]|nr:mannose-1-phosphate guanylyltransferase/mannose-6-phosphate isomerase [Hyphomicrobiaceae bacterium]